MGEKRYLDYAGVQYVIEELNKKINNKLSKQDLDNLDLPMASATKLGGIKVGDGLSINAEGVLRATAESGVSDWADIQNKPTTLAELGITDAASAADIEALSDRIAQAYSFKGSVATYDDLANIESPAPGATYNVADTGMNYAWTGTEWDALGTIVDLTNYLTKDEIEAITRLELDIIMGLATTQEALTALAAQGGNASLSENLTLTNRVDVGAGKTLTLDLNNHTIDSDLNSVLFVVNGGTLVLKGNGEVNSKGKIAQAENGGRIVVEGGTYDSAVDFGFSAVGAGSKVIIDDCELTGQEGGAGAFDGAEIEVNGGTISGRDNFALFTNGTKGRGGNTITLNGGTMIGNITSAGYEAIGIYIANNDTFVMNGGEILANNGAGLLMRGGNVTINDGKIVSTGIAGTSGWIGDNKTKMSKSAVIFHETANYPGNAGMKLTINNGVFIGVDHSVEILSNAAVPNVQINGGSFAPAYPET